MAKRVPIGILSLYIYAACSQATASDQRPFELTREESGSWRLAPEIRYLTTRTNFNGSRETESMSSGDSLSRIYAEALAVYGLTPALSGYVRMSWLTTILQQNDLSTSAYGLGDQFLGLNLKLSPILSLQTDVKVPAYSNTSARTNDQSYLGAGSFDVTFGGFIKLPLSEAKESPWSMTGGVAYRVRSAGYSASVPWSLYLDHQPVKGSGWIFQVGGYGSYIFAAEELTETDSNADYSNANGSYIVDSLRPTYFNARALVGYQASPSLAVLVSGYKTITGASTVDLFAGSLGLQWRWNSSRAGTGNKPVYEKANRGFVNYSLEAKVKRVNDRLNLVKIDKGKQDGVAVGQIFDIFIINKDGQPIEAIARAECTAIQITEAALTIKEYFKETWIDEGFIVKRLVE